MKANDLRDQRDLLVDKLSQVIKVSTVESSEGSVSVYIGGRQLVDRDRVNGLDLDTSGAFARVIWGDGSTTSVNITDGKMAGLIESRDTILKGRIDEINALATRVIESVNSVHAAGVGLDGVGGLNFFSGTDATDIDVDPTLTQNHVAAARQVESPAGSRTYVHAKGDSSNAVALSQLQQKLAQRDSGVVGLRPGLAVGGGTVLGVDIASAAVNTAFNFAYAAGAPVGSLTINGVAANVTVATNQPDAGGPLTQRFVTVDAPTLGVRVTIAVPATGVQDNDINTALSALNGQSVQSKGPATIGDQYGQEVAAIGVLSSTAQSQATNQGVLVNQLERQRQEISGVSIDEEATHLIQYQHAYQAAARVIAVMDSMLDTLINGTGAR
jgi:flagellar hook-associated protein 1 FlgK